MGPSKTTSDSLSTRSPANRSIRRYRINPLELAIFSIVTAGFAFSVYHLFKESEDMQFATLQPMQTQPNRTVPRAGDRQIATVSGSVDGAAPTAHTIDFEVNCSENPGFQFGNQNCPTEPNKVRVFRDVPKYNPAKIR